MERGYCVSEYTQDTVDQLLDFISPRPNDPDEVTRNKAILHAIYYEEKTLKAIGQEVGVCKERVRQIRNEWLTHLRFQFHEVYNEEAYSLCQG